MRLGLTTTPDRIATLVGEVARFGFDPVSLPCIRVEAVPGGVEMLAAVVTDADSLIVTSVRAAAMLGAGDIPPLPIFAVGPATAHAIEGMGGNVVWVGSGGLDRLAEEAEHLLGGKRIVIAGASNVSVESIAGLGLIGSSIASVELYTTIPVSPSDKAVGAVVFGSPTAVTGWLTSRDLSGLLVGAIGPTTASALRKRGIEPDAVPDQPGFTNTIERMAALLPERSAS